MIGEQVRVRVYNVGFGDSILLDLPTSEDRRARVLVDCGSLSFGDTGESNASLVQRIVADVTDDEGAARIDLVIATHRHKDHISGFARPEWESVEVGEVWQPWTENPDDLEARRLRLAQLELARAMVDSEPQLAANPHFDVNTAELIVAMGVNALSNADAVATLRNGFRGEPRRRYISRAKRPRRPRVLDGLPVHVLGPVKDLDVIRQMDPPSGQAYLALLPTGLAAVGDGGSLPEDRPFPWLPRMDYEEYGQAGLGPDDPPRSVDHGGAKGQLRKQVVTDSLLSAAVLDYALNNTSLMLSIQVGRQFLLFPGDSQWGTWNKAMETPWAADLLRRSTFYKVGHHGSHNATPRKFVDQLMPDGCWSIASVAPYSRWSEIPKPELLDALARRAPNRVFTTLSPPDSPPPGVVVHDEGAAIDFVLEA